MKTFNENRSGTGTAEWAEVTENICVGCVNNCLYCYAAANANRFGIKPRAEWTQERFSNRAAIKSYPARDGVVMFPSTHDITPFNLDEYIRVARLILQAGNQLLIVSKPRKDCIDMVMHELLEFRNQILFRFSIGTFSLVDSMFWEPLAPLPEERFQTLVSAKKHGFRTSVSMEPFLSSVEHTAGCFDPLSREVTDTIWVGKMNKIRSRVDCSSPEIAEAVRRIEDQQCDDNILWLYNRLKAEPKIRWKDSIKEVIAKKGYEYDRSNT